MVRPSHSLANNQIAVVCPTYNAGKLWKDWIEALLKQSIKPNKILIIDSGSNDGTVELTKQYELDVYVLSNEKFNHGGTRNLGVKMIQEENDLVVFLTQDAILATEDSLFNIVEPFADQNVAAVCGRQLPNKNAKPLEEHARLFNYPNTSKIKSKEDILVLGIKTAFMSNSFAAYRLAHFNSAGGFPEDTIFAEDMSIAAKLILEGYKIAYCSQACVHHSHSYTMLEEFKRYFDVGVFYSREKWVKNNFGTAGGEGVKFVISEIKFLIKSSKFLLIPSALVRTFLKLLAFKLGRIEKHLPNGVKYRISMNKNYWR